MSEVFQTTKNTFIIYIEIKTYQQKHGTNKKIAPQETIKLFSEFCSNLNINNVNREHSNTTIRKKPKLSKHTS